MNKEQILDAAIEKMIADNPKEGFTPLEKIKTIKEYGMCLSAMDSFAQQQSIAFTEWANQNYGYVELNKWEGFEDSTYTTDQLYTLFLSTINIK